MQQLKGLNATSSDELNETHKMQWSKHEDQDLNARNETQPTQINHWWTHLIEVHMLSNTYLPKIDLKPQCNDGMKPLECINYVIDINQRK